MVILFVMKCSHNCVQSILPMKIEHLAPRGIALTLHVHPCATVQHPQSKTYISSKTHGKSVEIEWFITMKGGVLAMTGIGCHIDT